jgi:hypothetical protein
MPSEFTLDTGDKVTPEFKGVSRVGIGARILASRDSDGAIGLQILRGDGGDPEAFDYSVRTKWFGPLVAGEVYELSIARLDVPLPDDTPRTFRLRVVADQGAELSTRDGFIATSPYAPAGQS